jgi:SOS-response transcriptional repressor LexA
MDRRRPDQPLSEAQLAVLRAVVRCHERDGRVTVRGVADEVGFASPNTAHVHLYALRERGLVAWDEGRAGTIRPVGRQAPRWVSFVSTEAT